MTDKEINELAQDALSAACLRIQETLGVETGDFASHFWCDSAPDSHESHVNTAFRAYIKAELARQPHRLKKQVLALIQEQFEAAWYEFGEVIMIPFNGRKVDLVFGTANETWGGDVADNGEESGEAGDVLGDPLKTSVPSDCEDPKVIADAILEQVYAWLQRPFLGVFDLGIRDYSEQGAGDYSYFVYFENDEVARVEGGAVRACWFDK